MNINNNALLTAETLKQITIASKKKLNKRNFIKWILSIDRCYFCGDQFNSFIDMIQKEYNVIKDTGINAQLLKKCGLTTECDIKTFMTNYNQLLAALFKKQKKNDWFNIK